MEGKNYWRLRRFSLFYKYYAFVDTEEYLGDQLFIQQKVEVSFGTGPKISPQTTTRPR